MSKPVIDTITDFIYYCEELYGVSPTAMTLPNSMYARFETELWPGSRADHRDIYTAVGVVRITNMASPRPQPAKSFCKGCASCIIPCGREEGVKK